MHESRAALVMEPETTLVLQYELKSDNFLKVWSSTLLAKASVVMQSVVLYCKHYCRKCNAAKWHGGKFKTKYT